MQVEITNLLQEQQKAGEVSQKPATATEIDSTVAQLAENFDAALPDDYRRFLSQTNGLDYNSLVLYGAGQSPEHPGPGGFWQGLIATNILWRQDVSGGNLGRDGYLVLGETSIDLLTINLDGTHPVLRDKISNDVNEEFVTVGDAVQTLIERYR